MEFVKVKEEDFPIVREIAYKTWPVTFKEILSEEQIEYMLEMMYSLDSIKNQISSLGHVYLLVKDTDGQFLGYVSYEINYKPQVTKIHKIYVLPETQGRGLGRILIEKVESLAKEQGNKILSLNVNRNNKAIQFYEHLGFSIQKTENIDIGNGFLMEDYSMDKNLIFP